MRKIYNFIKNNFYNSIYKRIVLSISMFIFMIFLYVIIFLNDSEHKATNDLENARLWLLYFIFFIFFITIPVLEKTKEKLAFEYAKFIMALFLGMFAMYYWLTSTAQTNVTVTSVFLDIITSVILIVSIKYFITRFIDIFKFIFHYVGILSNKIFNNTENPRGFRFLFERLTTLLLSISGFIGATLGIATSIKALIHLFK